MKRFFFLLGSGLVLLAASLLWHQYRSSQPFSLDPSRTAWIAYGGAWELEGSTVLSKSDERGAKLMSPSSNLDDIVVDVDLALFGTEGDAGIILRGSDASTGINAFSGFYAGIRSNDNSLLLGRGDYSWEPYRNNAIPNGVQIGYPYHLTIASVACKIAVSTRLPDGQVLREGVELSKCPRSGQLGLQSYHTPAIWKNLHIRRGMAVDIADIMHGEKLGTQAENTLHQYTWQDPTKRLRKKADSHSLEGSPTPISEVSRNFHNPDHKVTVRGTVTLLAPITFIEDATGGIAIEGKSPTLAIGDDVEVTGVANQSGSYVSLRDTDIRVLASSAPPEPRMLTAGQAARGATDGRFVALDGILQRAWKNGQETILEHESNGVVYRAISEPRRFGDDLKDLRIGSGLLVSGVLQSDPEHAGDGAFAILLSPNQDAVRVVHQAPWWTTRHIVQLSSAVVLGAVLLILGYGRIKLFYLMHIVHERQLLADDLHDTIAQSFAGIGFQLRAVESKLSQESAGHLQLARAQEMLRESHAELRRSITSLRVQIETTSELLSALELNAERLASGGTLKITCHSEGPVRRLSPRIADCFFRVGQEAVSNAIQHSYASELRINMSIRARHLALHIIDNGRGFPSPCMESGNGVPGMRRRADSIAAHFNIDTSRHGTNLSVQADLRPQFPSIRHFLKSNIIPLRSVRHGAPFKNQIADRG